MTSHKVLIIDADVASRDFIAQALREAGHEVLTAASADEGLALAGRTLPDVVLADPLPDDMPGEDLTARLHADPHTAHAPYGAKFRENTATFLFRQTAQDIVMAARREREGTLTRPDEGYAAKA